MRLTFRLKIALLSGLITGLLLVGTGVALWQATYRFNLERLDREIRTLGQGNLNREHGPLHYQRFEGALGFISGEAPPKSFLILVRDQSERVVFQSHYWPTNLIPSAFQPLAGPLLRAEDASASGADLIRWPPPPQPLRSQPAPADQPPLPQKAPRFETRVVDGRSWRFGIMGNPYNTLVLGMSIDQFNTDMHRLRRAFLLGLPAVLLLAGLSAWFLAQRALRPVATLTQTAERVTARGLGHRIPEMNGDQEFNRLIKVFNEMLNRLQKGFEQASRFSADASHELKTPLARLQAELEHALESATLRSPEQEVYSSLLDEVSRLKAIVQKLLLLSLADAGRLQLKRESVDLSRMLESIAEDCLAQAPGLSVATNLAPNVQVCADAALLEQAIQNLSSNAVKYNCLEGRISFELLKKDARVVLRVANTGPGIPAADRGRIFERFYRGDQSRSSRIDGVGLGLSLSREILRAHGGELELVSADDALTVFSAWLPAPTQPPVPAS